ncbi:FMN-binding protein [Granulicoccus phenolivorans]|uniref:FMN-binding protein n=1 Tax=Granulicoccus phenolivorans TaxID=266854 RepID=UPI0004050C1C|nr:FMN-binding protein [Granulicoccus phenolivorans]
MRITVSGGKVTAAEAITYPTESGKDRMINSRAIPVLNSAAVKAQSANIDMVSGATYTSQGYKQSLQSALDQAHL